MKTGNKVVRWTLELFAVELNSSAAKAFATTRLTFAAYLIMCVVRALLQWLCAWGSRDVLELMPYGTTQE